MIVGTLLAMILWLTISMEYGIIQMIVGVPFIVLMAYFIRPQHGFVEALKTMILVVMNFPRALVQAIKLMISSAHHEEYYLERLENEKPWSVFDRVILITFLPESIAVNKEEEGILLCHKLVVRRWNG